MAASHIMAGAGASIQFLVHHGRFDWAIQVNICNLTDLNSQELAFSVVLAGAEPSEFFQQRF